MEIDAEEKRKSKEDKAKKIEVDKIDVLEKVESLKTKISAVKSIDDISDQQVREPLLEWRSRETKIENYLEKELVESPANTKNFDEASNNLVVAQKEDDFETQNDKSTHEGFFYNNRSAESTEEMDFKETVEEASEEKKINDENFESKKLHVTCSDCGESKVAR